MKISSILVNRDKITLIDNGKCSMYPRIFISLVNSYVAIDKYTTKTYYAMSKEFSSFFSYPNSIMYCFKISLEYEIINVDFLADWRSNDYS